MQGQTIKEVVEHTISNNPKIMATVKNNEAYRLYIDEAEGGYLPKLDLTAYVGVKNTKTNPDAGNNTSTTDRGYNAQLDFEQLIYDGGLTTGQIDEAQFRYSSNKYLNDSIVDDIIYDSLDSYLNLVKYKNRVAVANESLSVFKQQKKQQKLVVLLYMNHKLMQKSTTQIINFIKILTIF
jgi:adhesin transport system outer membrane protein